MSLVAADITLAAGGRTLVAALDLELAPGHILGILGRNGAGKSTLLATLAGLARPARGAVRLDGTPLAAFAPLQRARAIGLLPQGDDGGFLGSVADFVALGRYPLATPARPVDDVLAEWELAPLARRALGTLSGGERQRARLAQLDIQAPRYLLLDEPLTHLDPEHQARVLTWARRAADAGRALALTLHDPNWAARHCDHLLFLYGDGRWRTGAPHAMLDRAALEALYGPGSAALWA
jgi:iron complex transport system ATP-binding protein